MKAVELSTRYITDRFLPDKAIDLIAEAGYDPLLGARPLKRLMQRKILNELSKKILAGKIDNDKTVKLDVIDGNFIFL